MAEQSITKSKVVSYENPARKIRVELKAKRTVKMVTKSIR